MKPLKVYIDNCSLNDAAPKEEDWTNTNLGKYLLENSQNGNIEVWASPASAIEIALNKDIDQRNNMARCLNRLTIGQRMMASKEFYIIADFLNAIEATWEGSTEKKRLEFLKAHSSRTYIALLGQLAALKDYDCSKAFIGVLAPKVATQLIQSKIFDNPKEEIEKRIEAIEGKKYNHLDYFNEYQDKSLEELEQLQKEFEEKDFNIPNSVVRLLQKNQQLLIDGYSLDELSFAADQVFAYWEDLGSTIINFPKIVKEWEQKSLKEKQSNKPVKPLNIELVESFTSNKQTINNCRFVLRSLVNRFHTQVILPQVSNYTLIKDIEKAMGAGKIPSGGIILDSSHGIAVMSCEILLSRDQRLNASVDYWYKQIHKETGYFRETAKNLAELGRAVERGLKHSE